MPECTNRQLPYSLMAGFVAVVLFSDRGPNFISRKVKKAVIGLRANTAPVFPPRTTTGRTEKQGFWQCENSIEQNIEKPILENTKPIVIADCATKRQEVDRQSNAQFAQHPEKGLYSTMTMKVEDSEIGYATDAIEFSGSVETTHNYYG